ncbi:hypothetical protein [Clostridium baratii]|uniref:hypothetical protein n=1 Tax=Clostridium baratii TaxID=1561 RepID=UPI0030CAC413
MPKDKTIERVNLRFNLDNPIDIKIWDLIKDKNKKGTFIKMLLYNIAIGANVNEVKNYEVNENRLDISEIDESAIEGF